MKREEWQRYCRQSRHTLESAQRDCDEGDHAWACFKAQQAAELALKGYLRATREYVTGHSVTRLLAMFDEHEVDKFTKCARDLDKVYIPTRYPDVYDAGAPYEYFTKQDAEHSLRCASEILDWLDDCAAE